jgi:hypothetical protein
MEKQALPVDPSGFGGDFDLLLGRIGPQAVSTKGALVLLVEALALPVILLVEVVEVLVELGLPSQGHEP